FTAERLRDFPNVSGVLAFTHGSGCAMQFGGEHHQMLNRVMGGMARHPNIGGYLLIGLGCEVGSTGHLIQDQGLVQIGGSHSAVSNGASRPIVLSMQDVGGTKKTTDEAARLVEKLLPQVNAVQRVTIPASEIVLGLNCGGSDGNSGITANAALGV